MKLALVLALALVLGTACGGKKSGTTTTTSSSGSAQVADPKPSTDEAKSEKAGETPEEDPCAVPPPH